MLRASPVGHYYFHHPELLIDYYMLPKVDIGPQQSDRRACLVFESAAETIHWHCQINQDL